ncbi:MAG: cytochrome c [Candidatus Eisenbacteria bacterium]|uniref:Cytochrome c n=1 Tax=Eiseniibacteriota bacterium TaxID=2212470 RepID=A0A9D6L8X0_UNCEI|nr:cytochrome c [Candidatus Eisenbacteria bacterium]MBI3539820.1 cytochrome c [Candidatus Eisenbacteria bacterium]
MIRKVLLILVVLVVVLVAGIAVFVASRQHLSFAATPYPPLEASTDSAVVARGRYIVRDMANCAQCHGDTTQVQAMLSGADVPLIGGRVFDIPPGTFYVRNITPDAETGIGAAPAKAIARALRSGVGIDGRALLPFMEFQGFSDEDLIAVVSYLKAQPPVHNVVSAHRYSALGSVLKATVLASPVGPKPDVTAKSPRGATAENGRYLVESVALCVSCHTQRDEKTGAFTGPRLGGSAGFITDERGRYWSTPNITVDPTHGRLGSMSEDQFVTRLRAGRLLPGSPMPWQGLMKLDEDDLRAIYRYIKTVPPSTHDPGPVGPTEKKS